MFALEFCSVLPNVLIMDILPKVLFVCLLACLFYDVPYLDSSI